MRNLTPCVDKKSALFVDFADMSNRYLRAHSLIRLRTYRSIRGFSVETRELPEGANFSLPSEL